MLVRRARPSGLLYFLGAEEGGGGAEENVRLLMQWVGHEGVSVER
ncbi:MAG: hypothetical protein ACO1SX_17920 [Actinomycetota bacterium]